MADQKRWFKVWTSLAVDMDHLPNDVIGAWTRLGCRAALVGTGGVVWFEHWAHLGRFLGVTTERAHELASALPSVSIEEGESRHGGLSVTFRNWTNYQEDSTRAERAKASRSKRRGEETRRDETRREVGPPPISGGSTGDPVRSHPKPTSRTTEAVWVGKRKVKIPARVRPLVAAWVSAFGRRFAVEPGDPKPWDLDAGVRMVDRHGLERVVAIVDGALRVGTLQMRQKDRWTLEAVEDNWETLVAMDAKGELT